MRLPRPRTLAGLLALAALIVVFRWPALTTHHVVLPDEAGIVVAGRLLHEGEWPYVDVPLHRGPLLYYWSAACTLSDYMDVRPHRASVTLSWLLVAVASALTVRRIGGSRTGGWIAALTVVCAGHAFHLLEGAEINGEPVAVAFIALAYVSRWGRGSLVRRDLLTGMFAALAVCVKQSVALFAVAVVVEGLVTHGWRSALRRAAAGLGTGLVVIAPYLFRFGVDGVGALVHWGFLYNLQYSSDVASATAYRYLRLSGADQLAVCGHLTLPALAALFLVIGRRNRARTVAARWLMLDLVVLTIGFGVSKRWFHHYWAILYPTAALMAGLAWSVAAERLRGVHRTTLVALAATAIIAMGIRPALLHPGPGIYATWVGEQVRAHTAPSDRVLVWGFAPQLLYEANRLPACGAVYGNFIVGQQIGDRAFTDPDASTEAWIDGDYARRYWAELRTRPPALIVDTAGANVFNFSKYPIRNQPRLIALLDADYEIVVRIDTPAGPYRLYARWR